MKHLPLQLTQKIHLIQVLLFTGIISCLSSSLSAQDSLENFLHDHDKSCGIQDAEPDPNFSIERFERFKSEFQSNITKRDGKAISRFPIKAHIVRRDNGTGGLAVSDLESELERVNALYVNANIEFFLCNGVNYIDESKYYDITENEETDLYNDYQQANAINIYFVNSIQGGIYCGYTYLPWYSYRDLIMMDNGCSTDGSTLAHELGHFFGLYHTHGKSNFGSTDEFVDGTNCGSAGDNVCDTPADPNLYINNVMSGCSYVGELKDGNGDLYDPNPKNIMSYAPQFCTDHFTPGQYARIAYYANDFFNYMTCSTGDGEANLSFSNKTFTKNGDNVRFTLRVTNNGEKSTGSFQIGFYASDNVAISTSDYFIGTQDVASLGKNQSQNIDVSFDICDNNAPKGQLYPGFILDYQKEVTESEEGDNNGKYPNDAFNKTCEPTGGLPNLTFSSKTFSKNGNNLLYTLNVKNTGEGTSGNFKIGFYVSENTAISTSDFLVGTETVDGLSPNESQNISVSFNVCQGNDAPDIDLYPGFIIDYEKIIEESEEGDNNGKFENEQFTKECEGAGGTPNLTFSNTSFSKSGDNVSFSLRVKNSGDGSSGTFKIGFYASDNTTISTSDFLIGIKEIDNLGQNETENVNVTFDLCSGNSAPNERLYPGFILDYQKVVSESEEGDNNGKFQDNAFNKNCTNTGGSPNLTFSNASFSKSGDIITYNLQVKNSGDGESGSFKIGFYASDNTSISTSDYLVGTKSINSMGPNESQDLAVSFDLCIGNDAPNATLYPGFILDYQKVVTESSEGDNNGKFEDQSFSKNCQSTGGQPNLTFTNQDVIFDNNILSFSLRVKNSGDGESENFKVGFYASDNTSISTSDILIGTKSIGALGENEVQDISASFDLCSNLDVPSNTTLYPGFILDYQKIVAESSEGDNNGKFENDPFIKNCSINAQADLTINGYGYENNDNMITFTIFVKNEGDKSSGSFDVGFYASDLERFDPDNGILLGKININDLAAGQEVESSLSVDLCSLEDLPNGSYGPIYFVDPDDQVDESDENNNKIYSDPYYGGFGKSCELKLPDLVFTSKNVVRDDNTWLFDLTVKNEGTAESGPGKVGFYASSNAEISVLDLLLGTKDLVSLEPGKSVNLSLSIELCDFEELHGEKSFPGAIVDFEKDIEELNEDNNNASFPSDSFTPTCTINIPKPDLFISSAEVTETDNTWRFDVTVKNKGEASSSDFQVGFYASSNADISTSDTQLGSLPIVGLDPEETITLRFEVPFCEGDLQDIGFIYPGVIVDILGEIEEEDENNNIATFPGSAFEPGCTTGTGKPNLVFVDAGILQDGNEFLFSARIQNTGDAPSEDFDIGFYASANETVSLIDTRIGEFAANALVPGEILDIAIRVAPCDEPIITDGDYYLGMFLDFRKVIIEDNEDDNLYASAGSYFIDCPSNDKKNLVFGNQSFGIDGNASLVSGWISNEGNVESGDFVLSLLASEDKVIETTDQLILSISVESIPAGESRFIDYAIDLCSYERPVGGFYLGQILDFNGEVNESNEGDNSLLLGDEKVRTNCPPSLKLLVNEIIEDGEEIGISASVRNFGDILSPKHDIKFYIIATDQPDQNDPVIRSIEVKALDAGGTDDLLFSISPCEVDGLPNAVLNIGYIITNRENEESSDFAIIHDFDKTSICNSVSIEGSIFANLEVFPNPFSKEIHIRGKLPPGTYRIDLINTLGQSIQQWEETNPSAEIMITGQWLPPGIYVLVIQNDKNERAYRKLLKE